jgi:hypothetical protein
MDPSWSLPVLLLLVLLLVLMGRNVNGDWERHDHALVDCVCTHDSDIVEMVGNIISDYLRAHRYV